MISTKILITAILNSLFFILLNTQICLAQPVSPSSSQDGWFWQNPLPQGNTLNAVDFASSSVEWAVGNAGTILETTDGGTSDGAESRLYQSISTSDNIHSIFFDDPSYGWILLFGFVSPLKSLLNYIPTEKVYNASHC